MTTSHSSGRPVLLIHGFGSSTDSQWRQTGWVGDLEAAGRTVIGVDLPGHGASKDLTDRDAADLLLDEAAQHGSVDAVGFSAGSWALLAAASERPELFDRIAVLGATGMGHALYSRFNFREVCKLSFWKYGKMRQLSPVLALGRSSGS